MIQQMLAIWSLVPLPFLKPAWTSGSSWFIYCWSLAWRILSITWLACAAKLLQSCPTLCDRIDGSPPGSAVPGILQARVLEWGAIAFSNMLVTFKILQARFQQYMNHELPDVQAGFRKGRGTRDQIANIYWIIEKARGSRKTSISALLTMPKPLTVWITIKCGKFIPQRFIFLPCL